MSKKRTEFVHCSICGKQSPVKTRLSKANKYDYIICPDCDHRAIKREPYEILFVELAALFGWDGVNVGLPTMDELDGLERAKEIRRKAIIKGIEAGFFVAVVDGDEIRYYRIEHTDDEILERALSVDELKRFWSDNDEGK